MVLSFLIRYSLILTLINKQLQWPKWKIKSSRSKSMLFINTQSGHYWKTNLSWNVVYCPVVFSLVDSNWVEQSRPARSKNEFNLWSSESRPRPKVKRSGLKLNDPLTKRNGSLISLSHLKLSQQTLDMVQTLNFRVRSKVTKYLPSGSYTLARSYKVYCILNTVYFTSSTFPFMILSSPSNETI